MNVGCGDRGAPAGQKLSLMKFSLNLLSLMWVFSQYQYHFKCQLRSYLFNMLSVCVYKCAGSFMRLYTCVWVFWFNGCWSIELDSWRRTLSIHRCKATVRVKGTIKVIIQNALLQIILYSVCVWVDVCMYVCMNECVYTYNLTSVYPLTPFKVYASMCVYVYSRLT